MPDKEVKTIKDLIFYQYSKIIAKRTFNIPDGISVKKDHYGFIKNTFRDLKNNVKVWSDILREDWQTIESDKACIYCGGKNNLEREHIIPKSLKIKLDCKTCDKIQGIHNQIWSCKECNLKKMTLGLYQFYKNKYPVNNKYYDLIPTLLEKKYLKNIYYCHECAETLNIEINNISVIDIDNVIYKKYLA